MSLDGWRTCSLAEVVRLQRGYDLPESARKTGNVPVMGSAGLNGWHDVARAPGPGVTIGRSGVGSMGVVSFSPVAYWPHNTTLFVTDFLGNDPRFVYYFLKSIDFRRFNSGSAQASLNRNYLAAIPVRIPSCDVQARIGGLLGSLDDKIELNRRTNETLEAMGRALFKSWFVDFERTKGVIPAGWSRAPLSTWADALSGGTPSKSNASLWDGELPWISPKVMTEIHADSADAFVTRSAIGNGTRLVSKGATLVMVRGMGLHQRVRVSQARREVTFNQDVKALVPRDIEPSLLLFAMLDAQADLLGRVESSGHGTGVLPTDILLAHPIAMPPRDVQREMVKPFDLINDRIAVAREESRTLAELRDLLLPRLLSGELRVRDVERAVEAVA